MIVQMMKSNVIEHIVPVVIEVKGLLEKAHSPLLKYLMMYLKELMTDYKDEVNGILLVRVFVHFCVERAVSTVSYDCVHSLILIKMSLSVCMCAGWIDILAGAPQMAKEVEYDLRKFEEQQKQQKLLEQQRAMLLQTPGPRTPAKQQAPSSVGGPRTPARTPARTPYAVRAMQQYLESCRVSHTFIAGICAGFGDGDAGAHAAHSVRDVYVRPSLSQSLPSVPSRRG